MGHRQARTEQRRLQVGMAVAVVPGLLVGVVPIGRNEAPHKRWQVLLQARLEFDGADRSGAAHVKDLHDASGYTRLPDNSGDLVGQVVHLAGAVGVQREFPLEDHGISLARMLDWEDCCSRVQGLKCVV